MAKDKIVELIKSQDFFNKVFLSKGIVNTDLQFYENTLKELCQGYEELKNTKDFSTAPTQEQIKFCAEIEFALGGLCKAIAIKLSVKLNVGSISEKILALETLEKEFNHAIQYFNSAIISANLINALPLESNKFNIAAQLVDTYRLMANCYKNLDLTKSAISALEKQKDALSQSNKYVFEEQKKKQIREQVFHIEHHIMALHLYEILKKIGEMNYDENKLNDEMDIKGSLLNIPLLSSELKNLIAELCQKNLNFHAKATNVVCNMKPIVEMILTAGKYEDTVTFSNNLLELIDASNFTLLQSVIEKHLEFKSELTNFNNYLIQNPEEVKIAETKLQTGNITTLLAEYDFLLKQCQELLTKIKKLKDEENIQANDLSSSISSVTLPDRFFNLRIDQSGNGLTSPHANLTSNLLGQQVTVHSPKVYGRT